MRKSGQSPGVYATGNATSWPYPQIIIASGDGAKASLGDLDRRNRHSVAG